MDFSKSALLTDKAVAKAYEAFNRAEMPDTARRFIAHTASILAETCRQKDPELVAAVLLSFAPKAPDLAVEYPERTINILDALQGEAPEKGSACKKALQLISLAAASADLETMLPDLQEVMQFSAAKQFNDQVVPHAQPENSFKETMRDMKSQMRKIGSQLRYHIAPLIGRTSEPALEKRFVDNYNALARLTGDFQLESAPYPTSTKKPGPKP